MKRKQTVEMARESCIFISDGEILDGKSEPRKELNQTFELTAEKSGEYYICLLGVSSDPISLKEGKIVIK